MDKMFKRTLLGAAVATVAMAGSANAAIELNGKAVQLYGQAAGFMHFAAPDKGDNSLDVEIESRIGFRGVVEFEDFGPNLIWQMEGGNAHGRDNSGGLGVRDTYLGLAFDGIGSFKYGRQLIAAYNYVDWPHSNPGLGNVFDWNNDIDGGFGDRVDDNLRFDSETFGGFNYQLTLSGMAKNIDDKVVSIAGSYQAGPVNLHAGYYGQPETDKSYVIVGASAGFGSLSLTAAVKSMDNDGQGQNAYSATAQYVIDKVVLKGGVALTDEADNTKDTNDLAITARLGYLLPSTYLFIDSRNYKMDNADAFDMNILVGAEYYF